MEGCEESDEEVEIYLELITSLHLRIDNLHDAFSEEVCLHLAIVLKLSKC